jgi:hypothetical protein
LALLLRRQYEFPQCGINKGNNFFFIYSYQTSFLPSGNKTNVFIVPFSLDFDCTYVHFSMNILSVKSTL